MAKEQSSESRTPALDRAVPREFPLLFLAFLLIFPLLWNALSAYRPGSAIGFPVETGGPLVLQGRLDANKPALS